MVRTARFTDRLAKSGLPLVADQIGGSVSTTDGNKHKEEAPAGLTKDLQWMFGMPSAEDREAIEKTRKLLDQGIPKATDGDLLSSRCNW